MDLTTYVQRLAAAVETRKKSAFDDLCFDLECEQLSQDRWSSDLFVFVLEALRDPAISSMSGSRSFVLSLYNDFEKLTSDQCAVLLRMFDSEADNFSDDMLRHSISDLVARKYSPKTAMETFVRWAGAPSPNRRHMALVGLEVLLLARRLRGNDLVKAQSLLTSLSHP